MIFILFMSTFFFLIGSFSIEAMDIESEENRRLRLSAQLAGRAEDGDWNLISRKPFVQFGDGWIVEDFSYPLLNANCKIHYCPGPNERLFDDDPELTGKPYFSFKGLASSFTLTPLNLIVFSDIKTLGQTGRGLQRAIGALKPLLVALYAFDDLEEDRPLEKRVYQLNAAGVENLAEELFKERLCEVEKTDKHLEDLNELSCIARGIAVDILRKIKYSEEAIEKLIFLAEDLQDRSIEADSIPATYDELLRMYPTRPAVAGSAL